MKTLEDLAIDGLDAALRELSHEEIAGLLSDLFMQLKVRTDERLIAEAIRRIKDKAGAP